MPHCPLKQQSRNGNRNRCNRHVSSLSSFKLLLLCVLLGFSFAQESYGGSENGEGSSGSSNELSYLCPSGPKGVKCLCTQAEVDCTSVGLLSVPNNLGSSVQRIILKNNSISSIDSITSQNLPSLLYIDASYNSITSIDWSSFSSLTSLEELHLQMNLIFWIDLSYFHGSTLKVLNVSGNQLIHIVEGSTELPLEKLYIENCGLTYFGFGASTTLCKLKILHMGGNSLTSIPSSALSCMTDLEEIKLNNLALTSLYADTFSDNTLLQFIDLSNNELTTLPSTVFDDLGKITRLNLAGNPWSCDCSLIWLKTFMEHISISGGMIIDEDTTYCSGESEVLYTITGKTAYMFSGCPKDPLSVRQKRSPDAVRATFNWTSYCPLWQTVNSYIQCGPSKAVSCVYDFPSQIYTFVQYTKDLSGVLSKSECRDSCHENGNSYFVFDSSVSASNCLCGDNVNVTGCSDCSVSTVNASSFCGNEYTNIIGAASILYDFSINISPSLPEVLSEVNFTISGGYSLYDSFHFDFGDAFTRSVLNEKTVLHTYIYPGQFEVTLDLSSSLHTYTPDTHVVFQVTVVAKTDTGVLTCPPATVGTHEALDISATFTSAYGQNVKWKREAQNTGGQAPGGEYGISVTNQDGDGSCESGWKEFRGSCIKSEPTAVTMASAHTACNQEGARLLRFHTNKEIELLMLDTTLFPPGLATAYYVGAEWKSSMNAYAWRYTSTKAFVFRETLGSDEQCVTLSSSGLAGIDCNAQLPYICEKDPVSCTGSQQSSVQKCYVMVSSSQVTWSQAQTACQGFTNGKLASITDASENSFIAGIVSSRTWTGLMASSVQGLYSWRDGEILNGFMNWMAESGSEPCMSIDSSGKWHAEACDSQNSYVCEYFIGDEVNIPWLVAGMVPVSDDSLMSVTVSEVKQAQSVTSSLVTMLPVSWFSESGHLLRWNVQTENLNFDTILALQIWRPFCSTGTLDFPGCNSNSSLFTCVSSQNQNCSPTSCDQGNYFCLLTQACQPQSQPCICASVSPPSNIDCRTLKIDADTAEFELVYSSTVKVPERTTLIQFEEPMGINVHPGDIVGFQTESQDVVKCERSSASEWRQPVFSFPAGDWLSIGEVSNPQAFQVSQDVTCKINAVYAGEETVSVPNALQYLMEAKDYTFAVDTDASSVQTCTVKALDKIEGFLWIYPEATLLSSNSSFQTLRLNIEADKTQELLVKLLKGSEPVVTWSDHGGAASTVSFYSDCQSSLSPQPEACQYSSSFLSAPYSSRLRSFPSGTPTSSIIVNVSNDISFQALEVEVYAYTLISGLEFYHDDCSNYKACEVTLEVGIPHEFHLAVSSGDLETVTYYENGVLLSPSSSDVTLLSHTFLKSDTFFLSVNASNPLSSMTANLTIQARIRANFGSLSFDNMINKTAVDTPVTFMALTTVTPESVIQVTWSLGNASQSFNIKTKQTTLTPALPPYQFKTTGNITVTLLLEDAFGDNVSTSAIVEVYRNIDTLDLSTLVTHVATSESFDLTIVLDNATALASEYYGLLSFTVDWGDNSPLMSWTDTSPIQVRTHEYHAKGTYDISVTVFSENDVMNIKVQTLQITTETAIKGLTLDYNGPKHVSEEIIFTASKKNGSNVQYSLDFGDSNSSPIQFSSNFTHMYTNAAVYKAIVTAKNPVSEKKYTLTLYAYDEDLLEIIKISAKHCVPWNETVDISAQVAAESPGALNYSWSFGNGETDIGIGLESTQTVYKYIGLYTVSLTVSKTNNSNTMERDICVEEEISGLLVSFESPIALNHPGDQKQVTFNASVATGSNLTFAWDVDETKDVSNFDTFSLDVTNEGSYLVKVKVKNDLNSEKKTVELVAMEVITGLQIECSSCYSDIYAKTQLSNAFMSSVDYGSHENYTWSSNDSGVLLSGESVQYNFPVPGTYAVNLLSQNEVSMESVTVNIIAQDQVGGVNITANSSTILRSADVVFTALYSEGTSVGIEWICDSTPVNGINTDYLSHSFDSSGYRECTVNVSNIVSSETKSFQVTVLDELTLVTLNHSLISKSGQSVLFAATGVEYELTSAANTNFLVSYMWEIRGGVLMSSFALQNLNYTFQSIGTYNISLTAYNKLSSKMTSIRVEAEEKISNIDLHTNTTSPVQIFVGETLWFKALIGSGSGVIYHWTLNGTDLIDTDDSVIIPFTAAGNYEVEVTAQNNVGSMKTTVEVFVFMPVSGIAIRVEQNISLPYISTGTKLSLSTPSVTGSDLVYQWTITHPASSTNFTSNATTVSFIFYKTGTYQVNVEIKNPLSSQKDDLVLEVQGSITEVKIIMPSLAAMTGSTVTFTGQTNPSATDVQYTWEIDGEIKNEAVFSKLLSSVGVYTVLLTAENNVSRQSTEEVIKILDPISNLQIVNCSVVREGQISLPLVSTIDAGTNVSFVWTVEINGINTTYSDQNISTAFPEEGIFNIFLLAWNDIGNETRTCPLQIHLPIGQISLEISTPASDYIFPNHDITFTVSGGNFKFATFTWNITGQALYTSRSNTYTVAVTQTGQLTLTLDVTNGISQEQASIDFTVKNFLCQLPVVSTVGATRRSVQRARGLELEVAVDPKGCTEYLAVHNWTVYIVPDCSVNLTFAQVAAIGDTDTTSPTLVIKSQVLDVGSYCVHFATGYHYTSVLEEAYYDVNITASPLTAVIRGGARRTIGNGSEICLDASLSFDPDSSLTGGSAFLYQWECTEVKVSGSTGRCFSRSNVNKLCYQGFGEGEYSISLEVSAPGRESGTAEQTIVVSSNVSGFMPIASVVCESCATMGNYRVSASQHVALSATCDNCQCEPLFSWKIFEAATELTLEDTQTSTGISSQSLVLSKWGALHDGSDYTFLVYVTCLNGSNSGTATLVLPANVPPSGGYCSFSTSEIVPLEDQITVTCSGWFDVDDPETLIFYKIFADFYNPVTGQNQSYPLYSGSDETQNVYLGTFTNQSVVLRVMVADEFGAETLGGISTITFKSPTLLRGTTKTDYLVGLTDTVLAGLIKQASPTSLLQYAIALGQQLNTESQKELESQTAGIGKPPEQSRAAIRDALTICLSTSVPITTLADVQQMAYALRILTDYSVEYLTEDSQVLMTSTLEKMHNVLQDTVSNALDRNEVPTEDLASILKNLVSAANARIYSISEVWETGRTISVGDFNTSFQTLRPEISMAISEMDFLDIGLDEVHRRKVASAAVPLLEGFLVSTLKTMMVNEESIDLDLDDIKIKAWRSYARDIEQCGLFQTSQISIPSTVLSDNKEDHDEVFQVMISHKRNPYTYGYSNDAGSTMPVQTLSFYETNGTYIKVSNLADASRLQIYMFSSNEIVNSSIPQGFLNESDVYDPFRDIDYKTVEILPQKSKVWEVPDVSENAKEGVGVHVQLRIHFLPNGTNSSDSVGTSVTAYLGINYRPSSSKYTQVLTLTPDLMNDGADHRDYTFFVNDITSTDKINVVATNNDHDHNVELSVGTYFSSCEYFETSSQEWSFDGCQAQDESIAAVTSCQCNHLTSFGGSGIVSISDIDFGDLDDLNLSTNPVVFIAVSAIFVLYVLTIIICRYLDRLDLRRISKIPLCGRDGAYKYEITTVTGRCYGAGTSAHVGLKLYGTRGKGEARHLTKPGAFHRNSHDTFLVAHDSGLGDVTKILVWHDNMGLSPSWFLSHVVVRDLQTGLKFTFLVNSWLSLEMKNGVIQKTVKAADEEELKKFHLRFSTVFHSFMADTHAWLSVSNRSDHSRFTRVQRATCCLTCIYLYMFINAMWYGFFKDQYEADESLSLNSFGWEDVVITLVSTVMVLPFLFGLSYVFKKSRSQPSVFQEALRPSSAQTLEIEAMCDMSRDGGSYRTVTPLGDWVQAMDRESTTDSLAVPLGLRRTVPMHKGRRKGSSDSMTRVRPPGSGGKRELWDKDNIMQSWPKVPPWLKQVKAEVKNNQTNNNNNNNPSTSAASIAGPSNASRKSNYSNRPFSKSQSRDDSDDDLQQQLDEMDAEIARAEEINKKRKQMQEIKMRRENTDELFDSDDEWVNEGLDVMAAAATKPAPFNPRKEAELVHSLDRRHSRGSLTKRGTLRIIDSAGTSKRDNSGVWRDGTRPSLISSSSNSKSKSTLSDHHGRLRSLSTVSHFQAMKAKGCALPPWCVYVAYAACAKLSMVSIILVLLYGYQFGSTVALKWLLSVLITMFASILIVEPLKVILLALFVVLFSKNVNDDDMIDVKPTVESNEQIKDIKFRPLGGFALLQAKEEGKKKHQLQTMLREVIFFFLMLVLFLAIVYINYSSSSMYYTNDNIQNKFYGNAENTLNVSSVNFTNMESIPEFWQWCETVLAESLHYREIQQTENFGHLMGPAWLRQIRGDTVMCPAASDIAMLSVPELVTRRCIEDGNVDPDTAPYSVGWTPISGNWTYSSSNELNLFSKFGQSLLYQGGGYVQQLGQTYNDTVSILEGLKSNDWVDLLTRAIFVEFTLYNPSEDLTSVVTLVLEFPISGGILTSSFIQTEKLLRFVSGQVSPLMVCQILFLPCVLYLTVILVINLRTQRLKFVTQLWAWIDLIICLLAWANFGLYITCVVRTTNEIEAFVGDVSVPAQLGQVALLHAILRYVHAFLVFLLCLKIVRQIRFARPLYKFYTTLSSASGSLMGVFFIFIILLLTYAQFGYLLFGSGVHGYHSFQHSISSLFAVMGSRIDYSPMFESQRVLTHIFFISFGVFVYGLVIALCVAVLSFSYKLSRSQMTFKTTLEARDYEMIDFMIKQFKLLTGMQKQKPSFRRVKFEGLPSLPSRSTSSHSSNRHACLSPPHSAQHTVPAAQVDNSEQELDHRMAKLLPTWDQVLQTFSKIEDLEKREEDVTKKLQDVVKIWNQGSRLSLKDSKLKTRHPRPIMGKPPLDPKATFPRYQSRGHGRTITFLAGRTSMTPPSTFAPETPLGTRSWRPFSDQGMRSDPCLDDGEITPRLSFNRNIHRVSPAAGNFRSSALQRESPGSGFSDTNKSGALNSSRSTHSDTNSKLKKESHPLAGRSPRGQRQAWRNDVHDTEC